MGFRKLKGNDSASASSEVTPEVLLQLTVDEGTPGTMLLCVDGSTEEQVVQVDATADADRVPAVSDDGLSIVVRSGDTYLVVKKYRTASGDLVKLRIVANRPPDVTGEPVQPKKEPVSEPAQTGSSASPTTSYFIPPGGGKPGVATAVEGPGPGGISRRGDLLR
jgi:hypothetical protein